MTTTIWRICVTMATLFYIFNSTVIDWTCYIVFFSLTAWPWSCYGYSSLLDGVGCVFDIVYPNAQLKQVKGYGTTPFLLTRLTCCIYCISRPLRRTFFFEKCYLNSTCVLCVEVSIISKLRNTRTSIVQLLYREIVKFASKSWDLPLCLWTAYFLIRGFTLTYTLHHMWFRVFMLLQ